MDLRDTRVNPNAPSDSFIRLQRLIEELATKKLRESQDSENKSLDSQPINNFYKIMHNSRKVDIQTTILEGDQQLAMMTLNDITEIKKIEKKRQKVKFKTIYFSSIEHDLRTPLGHIMSAFECLKDILSLENEEAYTLLLMIGSSSKVLEQVILQITELSRIEFNQFSVHPKLFNLREMLLELYGTMKVQAELQCL